MSEDRTPKKLLFGWLEAPRPAHGPRLRWKDRNLADLRKLQVTTNAWYSVATSRTEWRAVCCTLPVAVSPPEPVTCSICGRHFKSAAGLARHKCTAVRQLPVAAQPGSRQCLECLRWFRSAGGLAVHRCVPSPPPQSQKSTHPERAPLASSTCCAFHCNNCLRCFKSASGFARHNCHRGQRSASTARASFAFCCASCQRRFRKEQDLVCHKCRSS